MRRSVGDRIGLDAHGPDFGGARMATAIEVPMAVEKAAKVANRRMISVPLHDNTLPHQVWGHYGTSRVLLIPALPGTGIKASEAVRSVVESVGITDILTKCFGSTNPINLIKATFDGLQQLRTREEVARLRGVQVS